MTVAELISFLQTVPQDLQVVYDLYSEHSLMKLGQVQVIEACKPRVDGWVERARGDKETQSYLGFPGY